MFCIHKEYTGLTSAGDKKLSPEKLAAKLEEGADAVKSVYRCVFLLSAVHLVDTDSFSELPNYDLVVPALLAGGVEGLREQCKLTPGKPYTLVRRDSAEQ